MMGQPVKTLGCQHFKQALFLWAFAQNRSGIRQPWPAVRVYCAVLPGGTCSADLSLTLATAREIGNSLLTDNLLAESNRHLNQDVRPAGEYG